MSHEPYDIHHIDRERENEPIPCAHTYAVVVCDDCGYTHPIPNGRMEVERWSA